MEHKACLKQLRQVLCCTLMLRLGLAAGGTALIHRALQLLLLSVQMPKERHAHPLPCVSSCLIDIERHGDPSWCWLGV